jgi:hypothetical protein
MMNVLLVEPDYALTYPNLALMKFSAKHKKNNHNIKYIKGNLQPSGNLFCDGYIPNIIYISTMFTYEAKKTISCINFYRENYPDTEIQVGGIFASLMPDYVESNTGITPFIGCLKELDRIRPDYDLVGTMIHYSPKIDKWKEFSLLFSSRGCPRKCQFCGVKTIEPETNIIENWQKLLDITKKRVMFFDNNIAAIPEHFDNVINFLINKKLRTVFQGGFDVRILTDKQIVLLSKVKWHENGLRLAFDNMTEDGYLQYTVKKLLELGIPKYAIMVFVLFNFQDTYEEAMYRATEVKNLGVRPYPQPFKKLDALNNKTVPSKHWTKELARQFRYYWLMAKDFKKKTFEEFLAEKDKKLKNLLP